MISTITKDEFALFRNYIEKECGIRVSDGKEYLIESRLTSLMISSGSKSFGEFYLKAVNDREGKYRDKIVDAITTNETSWFRDKTPFMILEEVVLPELMKKVADGKQFKVRIWSAASSTGQEPYTIAMIIKELLGKFPSKVSESNFEIIGTDISTSALLMAKMARYDQISISRGLPPTYKDKYFNQMGRIWAIKDEVKKMVEFKKFNLQNSFYSLGSFDIIFCRNVAIYFSDTFKKDLFSRLARSLKNPGYFFLGSAESLSNYSSKFAMNNYKNGIYYTLK